MLEQALEKAESLAASNPEIARLCYNHSASLQALGQFRLERGDVSGGFKALNRSREMSESLLKEKPWDRSLQLGLVQAWSVIAEAYHERDDMSKAEKAYLSALDLTSKITMEDVVPNEWREMHAKILEGLCAIHVARGSLEDAKPECAAARRIREALLAEAPDNPERLHSLGAAMINVGDIARHSNEKALRLRRDLAVTNPGDARTHRGVAVTLSKLADLALEAGDLNTAKEHYHEALTVIHAVNLIEPRNGAWRYDLGFAHDRLVRFAAKSQQWDEALAQGIRVVCAYHWASSIDPQNAPYQESLQAAIGSAAENMQKASKKRVNREIAYLETSSESLKKYAPEAAKWRRILAASLAFEVHHEPMQAMAILNRLAADFPGDPHVLGNRAEVALSEWRDPVEAQRAIDTFTKMALPPAMQVGGRAFALAAAALRDHPADIEQAGEALLSALEELGDKPHGWVFEGTKAALKKREHPAAPLLIQLFSALEGKDIDERLERVHQLLTQIIISCKHRIER